MAKKKGTYADAAPKFLKVASQLHEKQGYYYRKWRKNLMATLESESYKKRQRKNVS